MNELATAKDTDPTHLPVRSGRRAQGVELHTFEDMWRFAQCVMQARLFPKGMESQQAVLIAIQLGAECGLGPMASLQNCAVINGRPSIYGDAQMAIIRGSGTFDDEVYDERMEGTEGKDDWTACVTMSRIGGKPQTGTFSVAEAKTAGLWGKDIWKKYPKDMLFWRARARVMRRLFSDCLRGIMSVEEARDISAAHVVEVRDPSSSRTEALAAELSTTGGEDDAPKAETPSQAKPSTGKTDALAAEDGEPAKEQEPAQVPDKEQPSPDPGKPLTQGDYRTNIRAEWLNLDEATGKQWLEEHGLESIDHINKVLGFKPLTALLESLQSTENKQSSTA